MSSSAHQSQARLSRRWQGALMLIALAAGVLPLERLADRHDDSADMAGAGVLYSGHHDPSGPDDACPPDCHCLGCPMHRKGVFLLTTVVFRAPPQKVELSVAVTSMHSQEVLPRIFRPPCA